MNPFTRREFLFSSAAATLAACTPAASMTTTTRSPSSRSIADRYVGLPTTDGAGVSLTRIIGQPRLRNLDPFLMLDRFHSDDPNAYIAGFPDHPHRGFETVTIMLEGRMRHRDSVGRSGLIQGGGAQWMTAGRGIIHSEMPEQEDGLMSGFQLWVNLPAREKMRAAEYQDLQPDALTPLSFGGGSTGTLIAGMVENQRGPVRDRVTEPLLMTLRLAPNQNVELPVDREHKAFAVVFDGEAHASSTDVLRKDELAVFANDGNRIALKAGPSGAGILLAAAAPIHEPIVQYGPFVMNTEEEIRQAFADYRNGRLAI